MALETKLPVTDSARKCWSEARLALCFGLVAFGCHESQRHDPKSTQGLEAESVAPSNQSRNVHPIGGGTECIEMYTVCDQQSNCTGAPLVFSCGATAQLPTTGETLRCVCP